MSFIKGFAKFLLTIGAMDDLAGWEKEMGFAQGSIRKFVAGQTHTIGCDRLEFIAARYPSLDLNKLFGREVQIHSVEESLSLLTDAIREREGENLEITITALIMLVKSLREENTALILKLQKSHKDTGLVGKR